MRLFFAIELPQEVQRHLPHAQRQLSANLYDADDYLSWTPQDNLHVTLKFLGATDDATAAALSSAVPELRLPPPFQLRTEGITCFPPRGPLRIVAANLEGDIGSLQRIYDELESFCEPLGFPRERRPYHPHVTIARARKAVAIPRSFRNRLDETPTAPSPPFTVDHVTLFESLESGGIRKYIPVAQFPLH